MRRWTTLTLLALALGTSTRLSAQASAPVDSATLRTARTLMEVTHAAQNFTAAFEKALEAEAANAPSQLPPLFLERFKTAVQGEIPHLIEELALVHARTYTREEMEGFITFFRTPVGQAFSAKQGTISAESAAIGRRWGGSLAMKVMSEMIQRGEMAAPR